MSNLLIDIGNTAVKACWADGIILGKSFRYQGENAVDYILSLTENEKPDVMIISTVRELSAHNIENLKKECGRFILMDGNTNVSMCNLPEYISSDRAASIVAARHLFKGKPCSIFDFGTILSVDFIDGSGDYAGGNVSLGCRTRFKALNRYSKSLPAVPFPEGYKETGDTQISSIEAGIISGIVFEIEGYIRRYPENVIVFTGGDANYFAKRTKNSIFAICNLVLMGLALIADRYNEQ